MFKKNLKQKKKEKEKPAKGFFWLTYSGLTKSKKSAARVEESKVEPLDIDDNQPQDESDSDSINFSTTISTINIDEFSLEKDQEINHQTVSNDALTQDERSRTDLIAKYSKNQHAPSCPKSLKLPVLEQDESSEFQVHIVDNSMVLNGKYPIEKENASQKPSIPPIASENENEIDHDHDSVNENENEIDHDSIHEIVLDSVNEIEIEIVPHTQTQTQIQTQTQTHPGKQAQTVEKKLLQESLDDLRKEFETRLDFAKQESRQYIVNLRNELELSTENIALLRAQVDNLTSICHQEKSLNRRMEEEMNVYILELEQTQQLCFDQEENLKFAMQENIQLRKDEQQASNDVKELSERLLSLKQQTVQSESDFARFAMKIKGQLKMISELKEERDRLQAALRTAQYDPSPGSDQVQLSLNQALLEVQQFKVLVNELRQERDSLLQQQHNIQPLEPASIEYPRIFESPDIASDRWAVPSKTERRALLKRVMQSEDDASATSMSLGSVSPQSSIALSRKAVGFQNKVRSHPSELRKLVAQTRSSPIRNQTSVEMQKSISPTPSSPIPASLASNDLDSFAATYYEQKAELENNLRDLSDKKKQLTHELSRVPTNGAKSQMKLDELETELDFIDQQMASTRKKMKDFGVIIARGFSRNF